MSRTPPFRSLAVLLLAIGLAAPAAAQTLGIGIGGSPTSIDPHLYNASPYISLTRHLFDRLVEQDARARIRPMLAEGWSAVSGTVWEFKLRSGVKWHDGRDFTAGDVAFNASRLAVSAGSVCGPGRASASAASARAATPAMSAASFARSRLARP